MLIKVRAGKHMIITRVAQISTSREVILVFFWVNISRDAALSHFYFYHLSSFDPGVGVGVAVLGAEWSPDGASDDRKTDSCPGREPVFSRWLPRGVCRCVVFEIPSGKLTPIGTAVGRFFFGTGKMCAIFHQSCLLDVGWMWLFILRTKSGSLYGDLGYLLSKINIQSSERFQIIWNVFVWCEFCKYD